MGTERAFPVIRQTVLDSTDPRRLAEFYRQLFGLRYHPGDEPPGPGQPDPNGVCWKAGFAGPAPCGDESGRGVASIR